MPYLESVCMFAQGVVDIGIVTVAGVVVFLNDVVVSPVVHWGSLAHRQISIEVMRHIGSLLHLSQRRACTSQTG